MDRERKEDLEAYEKRQADLERSAWNRRTSSRDIRSSSQQKKKKVTRTWMISKPSCRVPMML